MIKLILAAVAIVATTGCSGQEAAEPPAQVSEAPETIRVATFNVSMFRDTQGGLVRELEEGDNEQIKAVASIIRLVNPDIILLNEFDYDAEGNALKLFQDNFLFDWDDPSHYKYSYVAPSNTGVASGVDLDNNGQAVTDPGARAYGNDAFGYGVFEGQYGFAILSRYPIEEDKIRTFQKFLWKDMPGNVMPQDWYSEDAQAVFRLSSKNHVDVPVTVNGETVHILAAHPTPPAFDGPEDRNGRRNHDEIRLLADYVNPQTGKYLTDDEGGKGALKEGARFVILGDLNADPEDGDSYNNAILQLTENPLIHDPLPASAGGADAARRQGGQNERHRTPGELDTADFRDRGQGAIGNLRIDYALPSKAGFTLAGAGVFWPAENEKFYDLVGPGFPPVSSDHRLVWVDLEIVQD